MKFWENTYNPFQYIRKSEPLDLEWQVQIMFEVAKEFSGIGETAYADDPYYIDCAKSLIIALMYDLRERPSEMQNLQYLVEKELPKSKPYADRGFDVLAPTHMDDTFEAFSKIYPDNPGYRYWTVYNAASYKVKMKVYNLSLKVLTIFCERMTERASALLGAAVEMTYASELDPEAFNNIVKILSNHLRGGVKYNKAWGI